MWDKVAEKKWKRRRLRFTARETGNNDVPILRSIRELEEGFEIFVSKDDEYLSGQAKEENDFTNSGISDRKENLEKHGKYPNYDLSK